jgi:hypothetical protein
LFERLKVEDCGLATVKLNETTNQPTSQTFSNPTNAHTIENEQAKAARDTAPLYMTCLLLKSAY